MLRSLRFSVILATAIIATKPKPAAGFSQVTTVTTRRGRFCTADRRWTRWTASTSDGDGGGGGAATIGKNRTDSNVIAVIAPSGRSGQANDATTWIETSFESPSFQESVRSLHEENRRIPPPPRSDRNLDSEETTPAKPVFDWFDHWYPLHAVDTMDPTRPHQAQLLGMNLVLWNDGVTDTATDALGVRAKRKRPGQWNAYRDACPHRRAPLSEGRVEDDGSLLCSYHAWRFDGDDGGCRALPYSPARFEERHRRRARCEVFAAKVADGFLWVFPRSGLEGILRSEERPLPLVSELHPADDAGEEGDAGGEPAEEWRSRIPAGVRDFPCGFDTMIENTLDPAHFCAAHHGTLGNRYTDPSAFDFKVTQRLTMAEGFGLDGDMGALEFVPPCLVKYRPDYEAMPFEKNLCIATYCVPTRPGWVRPLATVLVRQPRDGGRAAPRDTLSKRALDVFMGPYTPAWLGHILSSVVLHQDAGLLHHQYRNMRAMGYYEKHGSRQAAADDGTTEKDVTYQDLTYTPNRVDKGIVTFRRWFDTMAGGDVPWAPDNPAPPPGAHPHGEEDIYDMWHAHTKNCRYCSEAYSRLEVARKGAYAVALGALLFLPYEAPERAGVTLAAGILGVALEQFNQLFLRYEYHHHEND